MRTVDKKELINRYKKRVQTGGVFAIKNNALNKWYIDCADDLKAAENRFNFMGDSYMKISADYKSQKGEDFVFDVLEELQKGDTQTAAEFKEDLVILKAIWLDKLTGQKLY